MGGWGRRGPGPVKFWYVWPPLLLDMAWEFGGLVKGSRLPSALLRLLVGKQRRGPPISPHQNVYKNVQVWFGVE